MNITEVCEQLQALSQEARLKIFKTLIRTGSKGVPAGELSKQLNISCSCLSFHLTQLSDVGLVQSERKGRFNLYRANCQAIKGLVKYLSESCCQ